VVARAESIILAISGQKHSIAMESPDSDARPHSNHHDTGGILELELEELSIEIVDSFVGEAIATGEQQKLSMPALTR